MSIVFNIRILVAHYYNLVITILKSYNENG
jgi:hypothetical protein